MKLPKASASETFVEWLTENWVGIAIAGFAGVTLITQIPSIKENIQRNQAVAEANKKQLEENQKLAAEKLTMQNNEEIANERYDRGCEVISTLKNPRLATVIQEGRPIVSGAYADLYVKNPKLKFNPDHFVGRGVTVCDLYGTTAVMQFDQQKGYAVAGSIAVTSDRSRMQKAQDRVKGLNRPSFKQ